MLFKKSEAVVVSINGGKKEEKRKSDILPKIISVVLAFILWFYVSAVESPIHEKTFSAIPIVIEQGNTALAVYSGANSTIDITVRGKRSALNQISKEDFFCTADISAYTNAGKYSIPVSVDLPDNVTLAEKSINNLTVYLDVRSTTTVPVVVEPINYFLSEGMELATGDEIVKDVSEITVTGPQSVLAHIVSAYLGVDYGGKTITSSFTASGSVKLLDKNGQAVENPYVSSNVSNITVTVPVYVTKELPLTVEFKHGYLDSENSRVSVSPKKLTVRGPVETLGELESLPINTIDEKTLTSSKVTVPIKLPDGVTMVGEEFKNAEVSVGHINTTEKTLRITDFKLSNPEDYKVTLPESLNVRFRGPNSVISSMKEGDVTVNLDLSSVSASAGDLTLPVVINIANDLSAAGVYEVGEYTVTVTVG